MLQPDALDPSMKACSTTASQGWGLPQLTGPLHTVNLSVFPTPFTIQ
jgi:hypothetical protein